MSAAKESQTFVRANSEELTNELEINNTRNISSKTLN